MKAKELMTKTVFSVKSDQNLQDAAKLMWEHDCGWVPVTGVNNELLAVITDRDIAMAAFMSGKKLSEVAVSAAQSRYLVTCRPDDDISTIEKMMQSYQVRRIPIVGDDASLLGVVSLNDMALAYQVGSMGVNRSVDAIALGDTLASICAHHNHGGMPIVNVA